MNSQPSLQYPNLYQEYMDKGYVIVPRVFQGDDFEAFGQAFLRLVEERGGPRFSALHDPALREFFDQNQQVEAEVYDAIRTTLEIRQMATDSRVAHLFDVLFSDKQFGVLEKMILRIDLPAWEHEIAHWHQDHFFVGGNTETITAWIPLQTVNHLNGCLLVEPGSHKLGTVDHNHMIGKRPTPPKDVIDSFDPIEVEMELGDVLLFHGLLFHSGQLNRSNATRYSFQFRYSPIGLPTDPGMGKLIPLTQ